MNSSISNTVKSSFLFLFFGGVLINLPLLTQRLTNNLDGLWNQDDYLSGSWEYSTGRWFWPILDRLRFGISLDPFQGLAALVLFLRGFCWLPGSSRFPVLHGRSLPASGSSPAWALPASSPSASWP